MEGKTVVITGATAGIGYAAAHALAGMGAWVLGVSRSAERCARAADAIRSETGNPAVEMLCADLSSMPATDRVAEEIRERTERLDVLVNNAGAIFLRRRVSADGLEMTFALNHLSGFLLTSRLLDLLSASAPARIINVSSNAHYGARIRFEDLQLRRGYFAMTAYGQSKLANLLFTYELARRLSGSAVTVNAMHPGLVRTNIARDNGFLAALVQRWILRAARSPEKGAETIVFLAAAPEVEGVNGKFFIDREPVRSSARSYTESDAARLWAVSETLLAGIFH